MFPFMMLYDGEYFEYRLFPWGNSLFIDKVQQRQMSFTLFQMRDICLNASVVERFKVFHESSQKYNQVVFPNSNSGTVSYLKETAIVDFVSDTERMFQLVTKLNVIRDRFLKPTAYMYSDTSVSTSFLDMPQEDFITEAVHCAAALLYCWQTIRMCDRCIIMPDYNVTYKDYISAHLLHLHDCSTATSDRRDLMQYDFELWKQKPATLSELYQIVDNMCLKHCVVVEDMQKELSEITFDYLLEILATNKNKFKKSNLSALSFRKRFRAKVFALEFSSDTLQQLAKEL